MPADVNPLKRRYESPRRREQAAATRREILGAAQRLFEENGYAATTMAAIADEAGVALKTVYLAFETKSGLIRALWDTLLRGEPDIAVAQQPWYLEVLQRARSGAAAAAERTQLDGREAARRKPAAGDP